MRADQAFLSKYLKSSDVKDKPRIAVISHVEQEQVGKGEDAQEKHVLYFEGDISPMVLNRTNWETIEDAFGDSDDWPGHKLELKTARVQFQGKSVDGIRVDPIVPKPAPKNEPDDEAPHVV
jgi:hypothetical protein